MTKVIQPKILYYGTPVILLTTLNEDGSTNISPISSSWSLGNVIVLGVGLGGKALENLQRHPECVINLPDPSLWHNVERLAPFTGIEEVPEYKQQLGFTFKKDKFSESQLTPIDSLEVAPSRVAECPIQIEARVMNVRIPDYSPFFAVVETQSILVHAQEEILIGENHINPQKWSPLIYNFRHYFGLGAELGKTFRSET
ncbi:MAG TPA: flavin reductase family protein [Pseudoneobacillus sp.]|nr:flavin reductase family protein [Pseudoneobacillus sp.]